MAQWNLTLEERFWSKVDRRALHECWPWLRSRNAARYGNFRLKRSERAHRVAWILTHGPIPNGLHVLHRCDNPPCCNPGHLFLGTDADNVADKVSKGRQQRLKGSAGSNARLTAQEVAEIRMTSGKDRRDKEIAAKFGISRHYVSMIRNGRNWGGTGHYAVWDIGEGCGAPPVVAPAGAAAPGSIV